MTKFYKCTGCGRIHVGLSLEEAQRQVDDFNTYYDKLAPVERESYRGRASLDAYQKCMHCGTPSAKFERVYGYENSGRTMQPIVAPD